MQKGKGVCGHHRIRKIAAVAVLPIAICSSDTCAFDHIHSWNTAAGGVVRIGPYEDYPFSDSLSSLKGVLISSSNPYSLEGLISSRIESFFSTRRALIACGLGSLNHDLYHEELVQGRIFVSFAKETVILGAAANMLRKNISGGPQVLNANYTCSFSIGKEDVGRIVVRRELCRDDQEQFRLPSFSFSIIIDPAEIIVDLVSTDRIKGDNRIGSVLRLDQDFHLLSGYRLATGEISGGVLCRRGELVLSVSCSSHPVLGETYSLGAARTWK